MIIFLNGVPNSGKSTVAKELVKLLPNTVNFELDFLYEMYSWMPLSEGIGLLMENATLLIPSFYKRNLNVVISYPLDDHWYKYLRSAIPEEIKTYTILLKPSLELVLTNRGTREPNHSLKSRITELYHSEINQIGVAFDNSNQTPSQTAQAIINYISEGL